MKDLKGRMFYSLVWLIGLLMILFNFGEIQNILGVVCLTLGAYYTGLIIGEKS